MSTADYARAIAAAQARVNAAAGVEAIIDDMLAQGTAQTSTSEFVHPSRAENLAVNSARVNTARFVDIVTGIDAMDLDNDVPMPNLVDEVARCLCRHLQSSLLQVRHLLIVVPCTMSFSSMVSYARLLFTIPARKSP